MLFWEKLWKTKADNVEKQWRSICQDTDFGKFMKHYRFKQFRSFFPTIWQDETLHQAKDEWWKIQQLINTFNDIRKELILPCEIVPIDKAMSAF